MQNTNWELYDDKSIDFIYSESSKMLDETFKSFRESINKSFIVFAIYSGAISYAFSKIIQLKIPFSVDAYWIVFIGTGLSICLLVKNLMPGKMVLAGTKPEMLIAEYYEQEKFRANIAREMKIGRLMDQNEAIGENIKMIASRARIFKYTVYIVLSAFALGSVASII